MSVIMTAAVVAAIGATVLAAMLRHRYAVVTVDGESMLPTLQPGDRVLVRRVRPGRVRPGHVVVLGHQSARGAQPDTLTVKRVAALPGASVPAHMAITQPPAGTRTVPPGQVVIIGDNQEESLDSRQCGFFRLEQIQWVVLRTLAGSRGAGPMPLT